MSIDKGGKQIHCDDESCDAVARAPIALRSHLGGDSSETPTVEGWLFIVRKGEIRHYCPKCTLQHLTELSKTE